MVCPLYQFATKTINLFAQTHCYIIYRIVIIISEKIFLFVSLRIPFSYYTGGYNTFNFTIASSWKLPHQLTIYLLSSFCIYIYIYIYIISVLFAKNYESLYDHFINAANYFEEIVDFAFSPASWNYMSASAPSKGRPAKIFFEVMRNT